MDKEKIIEILEDYEFFIDDDFGGHYEHINCSQKALTPLGIVEILDYISKLEQQVKKQKEVIDKAIEFIDYSSKEIDIEDTYNEIVQTYSLTYDDVDELLDILNEVSE